MNDLTGRRFGRLLVVKLTEERKCACRVYECLCDCGTVKNISSGDLNRKNGTVSCGCRRAETQFSAARPGNMTHQLSYLPIYTSWASMIHRCYDEKMGGYESYGAIGVKVCEFLRASPANLLSLIGDRPNRKLSLDRIDTYGHYSCGQCAECLEKKWAMNLRWATGSQQCRNRKSNRLITINGETKCVAEWCEISGISASTIHTRLSKNWPESKLLQPPQKQSQAWRDRN